MKTNEIKIEKLLYKEVINNINDNKLLVLAFSGGLDSTVLLDILCNILNNSRINSQNTKINQLFKLRAIHIHHGLNPYADYWSYHCAKECEKRNVPFDSIRIYCNKYNFNGIENTARHMRYQHLFNNLRKTETLLTAQHLNDQAETFLLALKRGSGPTGLSGMKKRKFVHNHKLLRPLLQCSKEKIKKYAQNKQLTWIIDDSNKNTYFDRNFLRLDILPKLKNRWPKINQNIARSAQLCDEQEKLLDELLKEELKKLHHHDRSLLIKPLIHMSTEKRQALIRRWLMNLNIQMPSYKKLHHIWKNVILSKQDTTPVISLNKQFSLRRFQKRLYIVPIAINTPPNNTIIHWANIEKETFLPHELGILVPKKFSNIKVNLPKKIKTYSRIIVSLQNTFSYILPHHHFNTFDNKVLSLSLIRAPHEKEKITIRFNYTYQSKISLLERLCKKKIKKIWQELKIPSWFRKNVPLLFYDNKLISALGAFITEDGKIKNSDTKALKIYWIKKSD